jgi:DNA-binding LytR/AlgR family response regulator
MVIVLLLSIIHFVVAATAVLEGMKVMLERVQGVLIVLIFYIIQIIIIADKLISDNGKRRSATMKIRLLVSDEHYDSIAAELIKKGIEIDDSAELILSESNVCISHLIGRRNDEIYRLETADISHIESFAHDIVAYCGNDEYRLSENLKRLEELLDPKEFIRVSNSVIVSLHHIKSIRPALSQKFQLTMKNGAKVDVTRTYYYIFKEFMGI